jgi:hypothetical protein
MLMECDTVRRQWWATFDDFFGKKAPRPSDER